MFGFINIYKPKGKTSHDIVSIMRKLAGIKQIGHTGTLDPFAEGVLPICIGKATRLIEYLDDDKAYIGTIKLGEATETYDIEGCITKTSTKKADLQDIENKIANFVGEVEQLPPIYSAIKVHGKKLYEYARKGEQVEIKPRKTTINELKILKFDYDNQILEVYIDCSKGTYIRSIAHDLGESLGTHGHLIKLIRVKAGSFKLDETIHLENLKTKEDVEKNLIQPLTYLKYPKYELCGTEITRVTNGMSIDINAQDGIFLLTSSKKLIAVAEVKNKIAKCLKVFN